MNPLSLILYLLFVTSIIVTMEIHERNYNRRVERRMERRKKNDTLERRSCADCKYGKQIFKTYYYHCTSANSNYDAADEEKATTCKSYEKKEK